MLIPTPISGDVSLYFHLPFCNKKCDYCNFYVIPDKEIFKAPLKKALLKEIEMREPILTSSSIQTIYFGGGTPALVGPHFIEALLKKLQQYISIDSLEITLEINPENHDLNQLKDFRSIGINRLSIGVQTFDETLLKNLNRSHSPKDIEIAIENAKKASFDNLSIDLMYDLPGQTLIDWRHTLQKATDAEVSHISLYNLSIEPHTVFYKYRKKIKAQMPKAALSIQMFEEAQTQLKKSGFTQYDISAFCQKNQYSKHNVGYWFQRPHLGFGPSAFSYYEDTRFQNIAHLRKYSQKIEAGEFPIDFKEKLSKEAFLRESLALHLRLLGGFDLDIFEERFGKLPNSLNETLEKLINQGLLIQTQRILKLSQKGILFHDSIASEII